MFCLILRWGCDLAIRLQHGLVASHTLLPTEMAQKLSEKPSSEASEAAKHEADHRQVDPGLARDSEPVVILAESALPTLPAEDAFHHPPSRKDAEAQRG